MAVKFSNNASTTLSAGISSGVTSFQVTSNSGFPTLSGSDWTYVTIDSEVVKVTAISGTTFTCDATGEAHSNGDNVELRMTAELLNDFSEDTEALPLAGGTMTGDIAFGDNDKAKFGANNELQIHTLSGVSYIEESGTGNLLINANNLRLRDTSGNPYFLGNSGAEARLYYAGGTKLATTNTGVDITGTVTADGATVAGNISSTQGGTAALPKFTLSGSTTTGLFTPATDAVGVSTAGVERLRVDSTGIDVTGSVTATGNIITNGTLIANPTGYNLYLRNISGTNRIDSYNAPITTTVPLQLNASQHAFYIADAEKMRINSSGNVGIGTSSPTEKLQVHGAIRSTNNATTSLANSGNFYYIPTADDASNPRTVVSAIGTSSVGAHVTFKTGTSSSNTEKMRIDSTGNVGVGTTAPMSLLEVGSGSGNAVSDSRAITISTNGQYGTDAAVKYMNLDFAGNADAIKGRIQSTERTGSGNGSSMRFSTANGSGVLTERIRLLESGGITFNGDTAAANALDDYEEGTWTPATKQGGASVTTIHSATYTKIGNIVHLQCYVTLDSNGSSTRYELQGMPFAGVASAYSTGTVDINTNGWAMTRTNSSGTYIRFRKAFDSTWMNGNELDGGNLILGITYHTAD